MEFLARNHQNIVPVKNLIESGTNPDEFNGLDNYTLLQYAAKHSNIPLATYLVTVANANIDFVNPYGNTALHIATEHSNINIIKFLVESGASINSTNKQMQTALHVASGANCHRMNYEWYHTLYHSDIDIVKYLVESGADLNILDNAAHAPLHWAIHESNIDIVKYLVESGANIDCVGEPSGNPYNHTPYNYSMQYCSPLLYAIFWLTTDYLKKIPIIEYLIKSGANVNLSDSTNTTPLHAAADAVRYFDVVKMLLDHGADKEARDKKGRTAVDIAREKGNNKIVEYIESFESVPTKGVNE